MDSSSGKNRTSILLRYNTLGSLFLDNKNFINLTHVKNVFWQNFTKMRMDDARCTFTNPLPKMNTYDSIVVVLDTKKPGTAYKYPISKPNYETQTENIKLSNISLSVSLKQKCDNDVNLVQDDLIQLEDNGLINELNHEYKKVMHIGGLFDSPNRIVRFKENSVIAGHLNVKTSLDLIKNTPAKATPQPVQEGVITSQDIITPLPVTVDIGSMHNMILNPIAVQYRIDTSSPECKRIKLSTDDNANCLSSLILLPSETNICSDKAILALTDFTGKIEKTDLVHIEKYIGGFKFDSDLNIFSNPSSRSNSNIGSNKTFTNFTEQIEEKPVENYAQGFKFDFGAGLKQSDLNTPSDANICSNTNICCNKDVSILTNITDKGKVSIDLTEESTDDESFTFDPEVKDSNVSSDASTCSNNDIIILNNFKKEAIETIDLVREDNTDDSFQFNLNTCSDKNDLILTNFNKNREFTIDLTLAERSTDAEDIKFDRKSCMTPTDSSTCSEKNTNFNNNREETIGHIDLTDEDTDCEAFVFDLGTCTFPSDFNTSIGSDKNVTLTSVSEKRDENTDAKSLKFDPDVCTSPKGSNVFSDQNKNLSTSTNFEEGESITKFDLAIEKRAEAEGFKFDFDACTLPSDFTSCSYSYVGSDKNFTLTNLTEKGEESIKNIDLALPEENTNAKNLKFENKNLLTLTNFEEEETHDLAVTGAHKEYVGRDKNFTSTLPIDFNTSYPYISSDTNLTLANFAEERKVNIDLVLPEENKEAKDLKFDFDVCTSPKDRNTCSDQNSDLLEKSTGLSLKASNICSAFDKNLSMLPNFKDMDVEIYEKVNLVTEKIAVATVLSDFDVCISPKNSNISTDRNTDFDTFTNVKDKTNETIQNIDLVIEKSTDGKGLKGLDNILPKDSNISVDPNIASDKNSVGKIDLVIEKSTGLEDLKRVSLDKNLLSLTNSKDKETETIKKINLGTEVNTDAKGFNDVVLNATVLPSASAGNCTITLEDPKKPSTSEQQGDASTAFVIFNDRPKSPSQLSPDYFLSDNYFEETNKKTSGGKNRKSTAPSTSTSQSKKGVKRRHDSTGDEAVNKKPKCENKSNKRVSCEGKNDKPNQLNWQLYNFTKPQDCFEAVRNQWGYSHLPDPHHDLTCRFYKTLPRYNTRLTIPGSTQRNIECLSVYQSQILEVEEEMNNLQYTSDTFGSSLDRRAVNQNVERWHNLRAMRKRLNDACDDAHRFYTYYKDNRSGWNAWHISEYHNNEIKLQFGILDAYTEFYGY